MKLLPTKIKGPKLIKTTVFKDTRGFLKETFRNSLFKNKKFPFDVMSYSKKNVLRGMHLQIKKPQAKIITVTHGTILDVAVDLRNKSRTFGKYVMFKISDKDDFSLYIPEGFAHGFLCLSNYCTINYKCSNYRSAVHERTLKWNDPKVNIKWPITKPILSKKDSKGFSLDDF